MTKRIAINGFGRIGRLTFRSLWDNKDIEIVAINDLTDSKTLAYLLEFDSAHGKFHEGQIKTKDGALIIDNKEVKVFAEKDAQNLPWKEMNIDMVIESTGFYTDKEKAKAHIIAGAKKVMISAPAKGDMPTIAYGVNESDLSISDQIISGGSCTTNCLAPVVNILNKSFGIKTGLMTTVHAVTNDQKLLDLPHSDLRRGRAAAWNIIPTTTGAAVAVGKTLPELNGRLDGLALRVPIITGSMIDLTLTFNKQNLTIDEINNSIKKAIDSNEKLSQALKYNTQPITSVDIIGETHGSIFDATLTKIIEVEGQQMVKVFAWYDNESSFTAQLVRTSLYILSL